MILIGEGSGNYLWDAPEFSSHQRRKLQGPCPMAVAGRMQKSRAQSMTWKAREPLVRWPEVALAMGIAKRTLVHVEAFTYHPIIV